MIPLGKTHLVEFAFGGWGRNEPMGAPCNPWDMATHRVAGGSSSGSAVAVAAGLAPAAIGSDTGGSVRIPASLCGITGLKTTFGLVSLHGAVPLSTLLDTIGPLAHTVEDCAPAHGRDGRRRDPAPRGRRRRLRNGPSIRGLRIAVPAARSNFRATIEPDVVRARDAAIAVLRDAGRRARRGARRRSRSRRSPSRLGKLLAAEAYALRRDIADDADATMDPWVRKRVLGGKGITAAEFIAEMHAMREAQAAFATWMREWDALLTPTLPITATPLAEVDESTVAARVVHARGELPGRVRARAARGILASRACRSACSSSARRSRKRRSCASAVRSSAPPIGISRGRLIGPYRRYAIAATAS